MTETGDRPDVVDLTALLPLGRELGAGAQSVVFEAEGRPGFVVKRYRADVVPDDAFLDALVRWSRSLADDERAIVERRALLPVARVVHGGSTTGVMLPDARARLDHDEIAALDELSRGLPRVQVAALLRSLAELMAVFERHGCVHGELLPAAILCRSDGGALVLSDCDTVAIGPGPGALPRRTPPGWTDPRMGSGSIDHPDLDTDRVMFARLFMTEYVGTEDANGGAVAPAIAPEIRRCIDLASAAPERPAPFDEWVVALRELETVLAHPPRDRLDALPPPPVPTVPTVPAPGSPDLAHLPPPPAPVSPDLAHLPPPPVTPPPTPPPVTPPPGTAAPPPPVTAPAASAAPLGDDRVRTRTVVVCALLALIVGFGASFAIVALFL